MLQRVNAHHLSDSQRKIVQAILSAPSPLSRLDLAREFSGPLISGLVESGHVTEAITADGQTRLVVTPLTKKELDNLAPWRSDEDRGLMVEWKAKTPIRTIASMFNRGGGEVLTRAWELNLARPRQRRRPFDTSPPAWLRTHIRIRLCEAERRGLDLRDSGLDLEHRAERKRFKEARRLVDEPLGVGGWRWPKLELTSLRAFREKGKSIRTIALLLDRPPSQVAHRLSLEGRSVSGKWTPEEDRIVVYGCRDGLSFEAVAKKLPGRTPVGVHSRAKKLDEKWLRKRGWTDREETTLLKGYAKGLRGSKLFRTIRSRGDHAIRRHLYAIQYEPRDAEPLSIGELQVVARAVARGRTTKEIADWMGWSVEHASSFIKEMGPHRRGRRPYMEDEQVVESWEWKLAEPDTSMKVIAEKFGVGPSTVYRSWKRLGLIPTE